MNVTNADVLRFFLKMEASRSMHAHRAEELLSWCERNDAELVARVRKYADEDRADTNPTLVYTSGTSKCDLSSRIGKWERNRIFTGDIYTCGIASAMKPIIDRAEGNFVGFAAEIAKSFSEFEPLRPATDETMLSVIVVEQRKNGRRGRYELIDGAHRLVALINAGRREVDAFVGKAAP